VQASSFGNYIAELDLTNSFVQQSPSSLKSILLKNIRMKIKLFIFFTFPIFILIFYSYICYALTII